MAFADLTANARAGLNYAARKILDPITGQPKFIDGKAYMDFVGESNGLEWYAKQQAKREERRLKALADPANATLAAQIDAVLTGTD